MRVLLTAIRTLPERDQDLVLALLLEGMSSNETWQTAVRHRDASNRAAVAFQGLTLTASALLPESDAKVVPIRFPQRRYEELKAWCEEHQFPMAAVVRGLVERFLDSQGLP
ncbi:MAG TPA: hypothetical protein VHV75_02130 [Solirubrobacteraceae bacterium]|nr:hypothetical protein [Solirubrobacteraceae bacterium]